MARCEMSDPPPDQRTPRSGGYDPTAEQIKRVAATFEAYVSQNQTGHAQTTKHNRKIRRWTRFATIGAVAYTLITASILVATIRSIQEARRATHAATAQAEIARDSEIVSNRAYVTSTAFEMINYGGKEAGHTSWLLALLSKIPVTLRHDFSK